jgi:tRNA(Ile)-lysidine synthetase-like protein
VIPLEKELFRLVGPHFRKKRYIVAVSGGLDSTALLHVLLQHLPAHALILAHYNHRVRGRDAARDAVFVKRLSESHKLIYCEGKSLLNGHRSEESLRKERLAFLEKTRKEQNADFIVTAHHADDQLETLCLRLLRGSGLKGLSGIRGRRGHFIRPLLHFTRSEISEAAREMGLSYRTDKSNSSRRYLRNRVRQDLIPLMLHHAEDFGGGEKFLKRVARSLDDMAEAEKYLSRRSRSLLSKISVQTAFWTRLDREAFLEMASFWKREVLRSVFSSFKAELPTREELLRLLEAIEEGQSAYEIRGARMESSFGYLYIYCSPKKAHTPKFLKRGKSYVCSELEFEFQLTQKTKSASLEFRSYQPGDRIQGKKLKELFQKLRVPRPERALMPVLAKPNSSEILWWLPQGNTDRIMIKKAQFPFAPRPISSHHKS